MAKPKLVVLHVSPWSERARWALDHHGIDRHQVEHAPFLGELQLRWLVGRARGRVTVPMLIDGDRVITQSWDIVAWADERGRGTRLIPAEHEAAIRAWAEAVDEASSRGRALVVAELLKSPRALDESLPPPIPGWLRPLMRPVTRFGTGRLARKYDLDMGAAAAHELAVRAALESLRARLAGGSYLHRSFTYADIVAATPLQAIAPVADEYLALGPATRVAWTRPALADEFADLLRWRDELYREHRRRAH